MPNLTCRNIVVSLLTYSRGTERVDTFYKVWFGWVLWHINPSMLFNAKYYIYIYIYIYMWMTIYAPPWGLSSLAKELSATVNVMQGSSKELSSLVAGRV